MGKAISYCYKCSSLLREDDFERGKAFQDGNRVVCLKCAPELRGSASTKVTTKVTPKTTAVQRTTTTKRLPAAPPPPQEPEDFEQPPPGPRSKLPLILGGAGALVVIVVIAVILLAGGKKEPAAPPVGPEAGPVEPPKGKPPKGAMTPDRELLEKARSFAAAHADDPLSQIREYEKVVWEHERTPSAAEARKEIAALKEKLAGQVTSAMAELDREIEEPLRKELFGQAIRTVDGAEKRMAAPAWPLAIGRRSREIHDAAADLLKKLLPQAEALAAEGKKAEAEAIVRRVRSWEIASLAGRIEEAVAAASPADAARPATVPVPVAGAIPVEKKPRTEEGKSYLAKWEQAMVRVASRDYAAAAAELERAAAGLAEPESLAEAKADAEDVKRLQAFVKETLEEAVAKPRAFLSLELRDGRKVSGRVVQVDPDRVELGSRETVFAEWSEVTAASIASLPRRKPEARTAALFCLAEGDLEPAKALLGGSLEAAAPKYWAWAPGARARIPKADGLEASAREVFYAAEREWRSMQSRGLAVEKYKSLKRDFSGSSVVRRLADRIERRSEACKEYYFAPADFERAGTLKLAKSGRLESDAETDPNFANQNWAEVEFFILPGAPYRAWLLAGGCCQENFDFLWQATELMTTHPRTKKSVSADVGGSLAPEVKPFIRNLKATHDPKTPMAAARWEWVELRLPKYAGPGPKRVRFMTDQKGFGIGGLVVSSSRKLPPKDDEVKEFEKARTAEVPAVVLDPDLVAWYGLDDGSGGSVEDAAGGHKGKVVGTAKWGAGKVGGALDLDGQTYVSVDDAPDLRITGEITISFWMNKRVAGGDWQRIVGKGDERARNYGVWAGGDGDKVLFQQYNDAAQAVINIRTAKDVVIGKWHHVAATVRGNRATVYFDGARDIEGDRTGPVVSSNAPFMIGWGSIHARFSGSLDDVRVYKRGLTADEVRELFEMGR